MCLGSWLRTARTYPGGVAEVEDWTSRRVETAWRIVAIIVLVLLAGVFRLLTDLPTQLTDLLSLACMVGAIYLFSYFIIRFVERGKKRSRRRERKPKD